MNVEFLCPFCGQELAAPLPAGTDLTCRHCGKAVHLQVSEDAGPASRIESCAVCGARDFYLQKDFNTRVGLVIFGLGVLFSYHTHFISLLIATGIDLVLYYVLKTVTICYQCRAIYREVGENPAHRGFDPHLGMKYSKTAT